MKIILIINLLSLMKMNSPISLLHSDFELSYPVSASLDNGNIFIIHNNGVYICDKSLSNILKSPILFSSENQLTKEDLSKIIITKLEEKALFCLIKDSIFIFDNQGNFLSQKNIIPTLIEGIPNTYTLFGAKENEYSYQFYIGFAINYKLYLQSYEFNLYYNSTEIMKANYDGINCCLQVGSSCQNKNIKNDILNCHIMIDSNKNESIICFYIIDDDQEYFGIGKFQADGGSFKRSNTKCKNHEIDKVATIKSVLSSDSQKAFICVIFISGENNCFNYDYSNDYIEGFNLNYLNCNNNICQKNIFSLNVYYFSDKNEYIFGCSGEKNNITTCVFNNNFLNYEEINNIYKNENDENINSFSYIYNIDDQKYNIIIDNSFEEKNLISTYFG